MSESVIHNHPTGRIPETVIILGLGETKRMYADLYAMNHGCPSQFQARPQPEVWTLNNGYAVWQHDLLWVMDDLEGEAHKWPQYGQALQAHEQPIMTSLAYPDYPTSWTYPFGEVCHALGLTGLSRYFRNSIPYMIAYACFLHVKKLILLGCDYSHPNQPGREADQANAEWWLGFATARGMRLVIADDSTLMGARDSGRPIYGYRFDPRVSMDRAAREAQVMSPKQADLDEIAKQKALFVGPKQPPIRDAMRAVHGDPAETPYSVQRRLSEDAGKGAGPSG